MNKSTLPEVLEPTKQKLVSLKEWCISNDSEYGHHKDKWEIGKWSEVEQSQNLQHSIFMKMLKIDSPTNVIVVCNVFIKTEWEKLLLGRLYGRNSGDNYGRKILLSKWIVFSEQFEWESALPEFNDRKHLYLGDTAMSPDAAVNTFRYNFAYSSSIP